MRASVPPGPVLTGCELLLPSAPPLPPEPPPAPGTDAGMFCEPHPVASKATSVIADAESA